MRVSIEVETMDAEGDITVVNIPAAMEIRQGECRLVYVEKLSDEGGNTRTVMTISGKKMRIIRKGEINSDFIYESSLIHNTMYGTPYGTFPVTIETNRYNCRIYSVSEDGKLQKEPVWPVDRSHIHEIHAEADYKLSINGGEPLELSIKLKITA